MNAVAKDVLNDRPAQTALANIHIYIDTLTASLDGPRNKMGPISTLLNAATDARSVAKALETERDALEVKRLLGNPIDATALVSLERKISDAATYAEKCERAAVPARIAADQLQGEIASISRSIAAECNRLPMTVHAALIETAQSVEHNGEFVLAVKTFVKAWGQFVQPFFAADIVATQNPALQIPLRTANMRREFVLPTPSLTPGFEQASSIAIDRNVEHAALKLVNEMMTQ